MLWHAVACVSQHPEATCHERELVSTALAWPECLAATSGRRVCDAMWERRTEEPSTHSPPACLATLTTGASVPSASPFARLETVVIDHDEVVLLEVERHHPFIELQPSELKLDRLTLAQLLHQLLVEDLLTGAGVGWRLLHLISLLRNRRLRDHLPLEAHFAFLLLFRVRLEAQVHRGLDPIATLGLAPGFSRGLLLLGLVKAAAVAHAVEEGLLPRTAVLHVRQQAARFAVVALAFHLQQRRQCSDGLLQLARAIVCLGQAIERLRTLRVDCQHLLCCHASEIPVLLLERTCSHIEVERVAQLARFGSIERVGRGLLRWWL
eukprot:5980547-Prymnesium_polylepis.2